MTGSESTSWLDSEEVRLSRPATPGRGPATSSRCFSSNERSESMGLSPDLRMGLDKDLPTGTCAGVKSGERRDDDESGSGSSSSEATVKIKVDFRKFCRGLEAPSALVSMEPGREAVWRASMGLRSTVVETSSSLLVFFPPPAADQDRTIGTLDRKPPVLESTDSERDLGRRFILSKITCKSYVDGRPVGVVSGRSFGGAPNISLACMMSISMTLVWWMVSTRELSEADPSDVRSRVGPKTMPKLEGGMLLESNSSDTWVGGLSLALLAPSIPFADGARGGPRWRNAARVIWRKALSCSQSRRPSWERSRWGTLWPSCQVKFNQSLPASSACVIT